MNDKFTELTLLNECTQCLSACGQCKFDVGTETHDVCHIHTTHTLIRVRIHARAIDPFLLANSGQKALRSTKEGRFIVLNRYGSMAQERRALCIPADNADL